MSDPIAVVVLNWNKRDDLLACLESVRAQDYTPMEIVVVDNGSGDASADTVAERFPQAHLVRNPTNLGPGPGRNAGLRHADEHLSYRYLLFLDNDTLLHRSFLTRLHAALSEDSRAGIACGKTFNVPRSLGLQSVGIRTDLTSGWIRDEGAGEADQGQYDAPRDVDACGSFGFLIRRELLVELGGFDPAFRGYGWEDVDLCLRARRLGFTVRYVPDAVLEHKGTRLGRGRIAAYERSKVTNYLLLLRRHARPWQLLTCAVCVPLRGLWITGTLLRHGDWKSIRAQFRGLVEAFIG